MVQQLIEVCMAHSFVECMMVRQLIEVCMAHSFVECMIVQQLIEVCMAHPSAYISMSAQRQRHYGFL